LIDISAGSEPEHITPRRRVLAMTQPVSAEENLLHVFGEGVLSRNLAPVYRSQIGRLARLSAQITPYRPGVIRSIQMGSGGSKGTGFCVSPRKVNCN